MHHPPHIFLDSTWYFVTVSVYRRHRLFSSNPRKAILRDNLKVQLAEFHINLAAWVILDNHYHILLKSREGRNLSHLFQKAHGKTAFELNGLDGLRGRQVWHNYWDTCIRDERDFWTHLNYIHCNPVKHGYTRHAADWEFSSYGFYQRQRGDEWLAEVLRQYPVIDFSDRRDDFD